jgi:hypothetical protein
LKGPGKDAWPFVYQSIPTIDPLGVDRSRRG